MVYIKHTCKGIAKAVLQLLIDSLYGIVNVWRASTFALIRELAINTKFVRE